MKKSLTNPEKSTIIYDVFDKIRRSTQEAEGTPLERVQVGNTARGFKSLLLRSALKKVEKSS